MLLILYIHIYILFQFWNLHALKVICEGTGVETQTRF